MSVLERICDDKRALVACRKRERSLSNLDSAARAAPPPRGFTLRLRRAVEHGGCGLIAEIKRASPSRGVIRESFDPFAHARDYAASGAAALSVLTEPRWFRGSLEHLAAAREAAALPVLRKDFLVDPYQVEEARAWGADAVLVIVAAAETALRVELMAAAREHGLDVLVEVHDARELEWATAQGATLVGVNNRDLTTFETTLATTERLAPMVPAEALLVAESGIHTPADVRRMVAAGARAVLVGEAFMAAADPGAALRSLLA
ncbi:MAG TPA: indole-3-glycerol phosphate synthase TrpC [Candidatus Binatia bacterium]|nr:indole-3-glycerol phosphate synthase TrpC [Candidatus Binatia bacterium]